MIQQVIEKLSFFKFRCYWVDSLAQRINDGELLLDFEPFFMEFPDISQEKDVILHFQARPKYYRRWGIYKNGEYLSCNGVSSRKTVSTRRLKQDNTTPSNIILIREGKMTQIGDELIIY